MKISNLLKKLSCAAAATVVFALPAHADVIALDSTRTAGNQNWAGPLGMDFNVLAPIWVTKLGAFDSSGDGFKNSISVGIFDRSTGLLVGTAAILTTGNTTVEGTGNENRYFDVADFMLGIGSYSIIADGYSDLEMNGNPHGGSGGPRIQTVSSLIAFTGDSRYGDQSLGLLYPTRVDGGPSNRYDAGTFQFTAVPEPGTIALAGLGLVGLGLMRRKKRA